MTEAAIPNSRSEVEALAGRTTDVPESMSWDSGLRRTITIYVPLALFVIVLLFLLVQNQIDRRDPKLAVLPSNAEPELTFGPILRPGGATA